MHSRKTILFQSKEQEQKEKKLFSKMDMGSYGKLYSIF